MSARRTKASRRAAFRGWLARLAAQSAPTGPVWVVRLDPALLRHTARRMKQALREIERAMRAAAPKVRAIMLSFNLPGGPVNAARGGA